MNQVFFYVWYLLRISLVAYSLNPFMNQVFFYSLLPEGKSEGALARS